MGTRRLVDMLDSEEEAPMVSERSRRTRGGRGLSGQLVSRDRRGLFDYDEQGPLQHVRLAPQVSNTRRGTYTATPNTDWQPWSDEETKDGTSELEVPMEYLPLSPNMVWFPMLIPLTFTTERGLWEGLRHVLCMSIRLVLICASTIRV